MSGLKLINFTSSFAHTPFRTTLCFSPVRHSSLRCFVEVAVTGSSPPAVGEVILDRFSRPVISETKLVGVFFGLTEFMYLNRISFQHSVVWVYGYLGPSPLSIQPEAVYGNPSPNPFSPLESDTLPPSLFPPPTLTAFDGRHSQEGYSFPFPFLVLALSLRFAGRKFRFYGARSATGILHPSESGNDK